VVLKNLPACPTKMLTVLLEALLDGVVAIRHLLSAKPRRIARTRAAFLWRAASGLRPCTATSENQRGDGRQDNSVHFAPPQDDLRWPVLKRPERRPAQKISSGQRVRIYFPFCELSQ
jgi:hypothetical protein